MTRTALAAILAIALSPAQAASLREIATRAVQHDPRMAAAGADIDAANAAREVAQSSDHFTAGFSADVGRSDLRTSARFPQPGVRTPNSLALQASQPLYSGGRTAAQDEAARLAAEAALERRRDTGGKIILAALTATLDLKRDRETLRLSETNHQALAQARDDVAKRLKAGEATRTDLAQADARVAEARANLRRAQAQRASSEISLERLIGTLPADLEIAWPASLPLAKSRAEAIAQSARAPAPLAAAQQALAAAAQVKAAAAERMPKLSLDGRAATQDNTEFGYERLSTWAVQLKLEVPLYTGGRVSNRISEASARASSARYLAEDAEALYAETAAREWELMQADQDVIEATNSQLAAAELALDGIKKELAVGSRTTLDLLDAERDLLAAQVSHVGAERDRAVTAFRLLAACGRLELYNVPE